MRRLTSRLPGESLASSYGPALRFFRAGLRVTRPDWPRLALLVVLSLLSGGFEVLLLGLLAAMIVAMAGTHLPALPHGMHRFSGSLLPLLAGMLIVCLVALVFPLARLGAALSTGAMVRLRERLIRAYHTASLAYRDSHRENYLAQLAGESCTRCEQLVQHMVSALASTAILAVFVAAAIATAPRMALALLAGLCLFALLLAPLLRKMRRARQVNTTLQREMLMQVGQMARLSEQIAAFHVGRRAAEVLDTAAGSAARTMYRLRYENRLLPSLYQYGGLAVVLAIILTRQVVGSQDYAGLAPLAFLLVRALGYVKTLSGAVQNGIEQVPFTEILIDELRALEAHSAPSGSLAPSRFAGLAFEGVSYAYKAGQPVLKDASFEIRPGEIVGVVGPSGGGKSTLASLMLRLRVPTAGHIRAGDMPLNEVSAEAWASLSAYVSQDSKLIHGTVADNIRFFRPQYDLSRVTAAARSAHIDAEIAALPDGYETVVGMGARDLSGGQRQRLAIARALLGLPQFLVLDEPTSALDKPSELLMAQTLRELKGRTTVLVIAHRADTLAVCDRILHVEDGRVRELPPAIR